jgi:Na+-transporting NADH:ubiquinone oxidoreductase subunit B
MLRRLLDRIHPLFAKGGILQRFHSLYEAGDTFLYTPGEVTITPSHVRDALDLKRLMTIVVIALLPCFAMAMYNTGYQAHLAMEVKGIEAAEGWRGAVMGYLGLGYSPDSVLSCFVHGALYFLPVYIVTLAAGGFWETLFAMIRKHEINEGFLVTSALFPLTLPPTIPLWQVAIGISFGVVIGKEIFGGTGRNFLNPALTARAFLYFAHAPNISGDNSVWIAAKTTWTQLDGASGATVLGAAASDKLGMSAIDTTWWDAFLGFIPGSMGETSTLACLIGAVILIATGIGSWRIMAGVLAGGMGFSTLLWLLRGYADSPIFDMPPWWHLVAGGYAFGLVFMATDPVSAAMTETGKWIYGVLIGIMTMLIRVVNPAYPEGIMLAILFGNVFAPLIDYFVVQANIKRRLARNAA